MQRLFFFFVIFLISAFLFPVETFAQNQSGLPNQEIFEAKIVKILEEKEIKLAEREQMYQKIQLQITNGPRKGEKITVENGNIPVASPIKYETGEKVVLTVVQDPEGEEVIYISGYVRRTPIYFLFGIFMGLTVIIGRKRGLTSLLGMAFSFLVIFIFILPQISSGRNPVLIALISSLFIIPVNYYLSHGFNRKTNSAIAGTIIALMITGVLAAIFVEAVKLSGFASEEAAFVETANPGLVNIRGLLLAGIIIGALGILDDVTVSQAAVVYQLKKAAGNLSFGKLYLSAMDVGRDHIASVVNTLVLVYTGAALPLLVLFINNPMSPAEVLNFEILAEEIVRTLVASIGLILAVPITTFLAAYSTRVKFKK